MALVDTKTFKIIIHDLAKIILKLLLITSNMAQ